MMREQFKRLNEGSTLRLDICQKGIEISRLRANDTAASRPSNLHLLLLPNEDGITRGWTDCDFCRVPSLKALRAMISDVLHQSFIREAHVVIGVKHDPFNPFAPKFQTALQCLELVAGLHPRSLRLQTRSPLVLLAVPVLKGLGKRASVAVAIETLDENVHLEYFAELPRPGERLAAAKTLKESGIETLIQFAPMLPAGLESDVALHWAIDICRSCSAVRFARAADLFLGGQKEFEQELGGRPSFCQSLNEEGSELLFEQLLLINERGLVDARNHLLPSPEQQAAA